MAEVTMKLRVLVSKFPSIQKLREAPKVRAKLAFDLAVLAGQATAVVRNFEEARAKVVMELGEKSKDGFAVPPDKQAEFQEQMDELLNADVVLKAEPVGIPANFEMDGLVGILADWPEFLTVKE
jgi:hypothetical protein